MQQHLQQTLWLLIVTYGAVLPLAIDADYATKLPNRHAAAVVVVVAGSAAHTSGREHVNRSCLSTVCDDIINLQHVMQIERYMRHDLDPCVDFHAYACGAWHEVHGEEEGISAMAVGSQRLNERYVQLFEHLLRQPAHPLQRDSVFAKLLAYYSACVGSVAQGRLTLSGYLARLAAHDPQLTQVTHWSELLARLGRYGYTEHFVQLEVKQHNATSHAIFVQPHNAALKVNLSVAVHAALSPYTNLSLTALRQAFTQLEAELSELVFNATPQVDEEAFTLFSLAELAAAVRNVNWPGMLSLQFGGTFGAHPVLYVDNEHALRQTVQYLNNASAQLLQLYTLARFLNYLQAQPHNPLNTAANGRNCVRHMRKTLYLPMNYMYERAVFAPRRAAGERIIRGVFAELKAEFGRTLTANAMRLSAELLRAMQTKLLSLRLNIGNLPSNVSAEFYSAGMAHLKVGSDFYENHLQSLLHYYAHLAAIGSAQAHTHTHAHAHAHIESMDHTHWQSFNHHAPNMLDNIDATPYFYCLSNIIIIPFGYLQLPFYDEHFWPALLYGDLANTLGHELLHAFDAYFIDYDEDGNMRDYSTQLQQNAQYLANMQCLNGTAVEFLNERIADISGTRLALHTYMRTPNARSANGRLYFLQFAQFFCGDDSDAHHDSGSKRLNYTLAHMPEFAEVYGCAIGSPMNPLQRCQLW